LIGKVLTSTTVEYPRLAHLLHKKQLVFQLKEISEVEDDRKHFLGGSSLLKRRWSTNFFLHA